MKLITKELEKRFKEVGSQELAVDPLVITKFYGGSSASWFATEYDPSTNTCYGYVKGLCPGGDEFGTWSMEELESVRFPPFNLPVERDMYFGEMTLSEACPELEPIVKRRQELIEIKKQREDIHELGKER